MLLGRLLRETSGSMATEEPMAVGAEAPMQGEAMQGEAPAAQASEESAVHDFLYDAPSPWRSPARLCPTPAHAAWAGPPRTGAGSPPGGRATHAARAFDTRSHLPAATTEAAATDGDR